MDDGSMYTHPILDTRHPNNDNLSKHMTQPPHIQVIFR